MTQEAHFAYLIALHPDVSQKEFTLEKDTCTIGRFPDLCDLLISRPTVSRIHARIERKGSHYVIENLSRNKTFINGAPLEGTHVLSDRDVIGLAAPEPLLRFVDADPTVTVSLTGRLRFNSAVMQFALDGRPLELTPTQFKLLSYLFQHMGEVCTRENCEEALWGAFPVVEPSALHRLIADLRAEIHRLDPNIDPLETRRGVGYILNPV